MIRILEQVFFDNTLLDYIITTAIILFVLLLNKFISRHVARLFFNMGRRLWKTLNEQHFTSLIVYPLSIFLVITVSIIALYRLNFPRVLNITIYKYTVQQIFHTIGTIVQIAAFIWLLLRLIDFIAMLLEQKARQTFAASDNQLIVYFRDFLKVIIGIMGLLMIIHMAFNYNISSLLTGLSILGAAIALALRESLENLIASFIIFFDKPFNTGDTVKVHSVTGSVERIGLRSTRLRTTDKSYVTVPNKQMVDSILDNMSRRSMIRSELLLQLSLQTTPHQIELLIGEIKNFITGIEEVQTSNVLFNDIRQQSFIIFIEFFTIPIEGKRFNAIKQELNLYVLQTMELHNIKIATENKQ